MASTPQETNKPLTVSFLGCGSLGLAILEGVLKSLTEHNSNTEGVPARLPSRFIACVRSSESAGRIRAALSDHLSSVEVLQNENVSAVRQSQTVILGCQPDMVKDVLSEPGMADALRDKLLISICAGVTVEQMQSYLQDSGHSGSVVASRYHIVRTMPNVASLIREGMTMIATSEPPLSSDMMTLVTWIFRQVGEVVHLPPSHIDVVAVLGGSTPAFFSLVLEGAIDGAVAMGLPRTVAQKIATQAMRGTTGLIQNGEPPALLRENVSTPGGCTIGGVLVLEEGCVRGNVARAVRKGTVVASQLGAGARNVNGTRS